MIIMRAVTVFPMGDGPALSFAVRALKKQGVNITAALSENVTHVLLSVPSKEADLSGVPANVTVIGGKLDHIPDMYPKVDLLREEQYLAENAALTADCALRLLGERLGVPFRGCPILVIGWGRIGKCLAAMLKALGADVSVAARKESDLGMLTALGYGAVEVRNIDPSRYRAIVNTAPAPVLAAGGNCVKIDLASRLGMAGEDVLWARGLPGKMLPEASGALIAQGVLRYLQEGEV